MRLEKEQHCGVGPKHPHRICGVIRVPVGAGRAVGLGPKEHREGIPKAWRGTPKPTEEGRRQDVAMRSSPGSCSSREAAEPAPSPGPAGRKEPEGR